MCRPLKDIVAELEAKYGKLGLATLEERSVVIRDYDACMEYLLKLMDSYVSEVKYTLEHNLSLSIISRITQNLIIDIVHAHKLLCSYSDAGTIYLMDERYDQNYKCWKGFGDKAGVIKALIDSLNENNIFCVEEVTEESYLTYYDVVIGFDDSVPPEVKTENELAIKSGAKLLKCLYSVLEMMEDELDTTKTKGLWLEEELVAEFYELNYLLYATKYWPDIERNFRPHIIKHYLKGNACISDIERLRLDKVRDFENHTDTGKIWRDYSENTIQLATKLKEQIKTDTEWLYFFQCIFELEEYDRWIDELRNPPVAKIKAAVLTGNKQFMAIMANAVEQGLCTQSDWQFKWKEKIDAVYFASVASHKFNLSNRHDQDGDLSYSWKPFEALFDEKGFRSVFNDYKNGKYKLLNKEKIDKLLK